MDALVLKTFRVAKLHRQNRIIVAGGVACNSYLRRRFAAQAEIEGKQVFFPSPRLCTDNGDMIAYTAHTFYKKRTFMPIDGTAYGTDPFINRY